MRLFTRCLLLIFLFYFSGSSVSAQTLGVTADVTSGCAPLVVHFHGTGGASGDSYHWDFGTGSSSVLYPDASTSFTTPGTYTVTLTDVTTGATATITVTVYPSPTVHFTASDTAVCPGTPITFTSTTTAGVPGTLLLTWNFGDGISATGNPVTHTYTSPGYYNVTLSATNSNGCTSSLTLFSYIHVFSPAVPSFTVNSNYFCHPPGHAIFTNLTTGTPGFTYRWNFGDGSPPSTAINPTHDYTAPGSYTVTLVVTDGNGCTDSLVQPGYIFVGNIIAGFTFPSTACVYSLVTFTNTSTPHLTSTWTFGDGGTGTGDPGMHIYSAPGTYTVTLVIYDGHCYDTISHTITILPGPAASFSVSPALPCPPFSVTFTGTAPAGTIISWLYGDGAGGSGTSSSHTYGVPGVDTIKMISTDGVTGCKDTVKRLDTLYNLDFHASATPSSGCKPLTVDFFTSLLTEEPDSLPHPYPDPITSYTWTFGDGSPTVGGGGSPVHIYTAVGVYYAIVTATTSNGCTVTDSVKIAVGVPPVATFSATPTHQCYRNNMVIFTGIVISGPVNGWQWLWGDGNGETDSIPTAVHVYSLPGIYTIKLTPYYNGCAGPQVTFTDYITIDSPKAMIGNTILCSPPTRVNFGDSSVGDDTHLWIFGDGSTSTLKNPVHDYPGLTSYTVTLTTYNAGSGCRDTAIQVVSLAKPLPQFTAVDTAICRDSLVVFTATVTGGTAFGYLWHSGGISADSSSAIYIDTFHTTGIYSIRLIMIDQNGCLDTVIRNNYIHVAKPVASFSVSPPMGCAPLTVTFTDHSTDIAGTTYTNFNWDFGDGGTASVGSSPTSYTFTNAGTFTSTEIVTDNIGCKDTAVLSLVTVYRPHAVFAASNTFPCTGSPVTFSNLSTGISGSHWIFGDGDTSDVTSPTHLYALPGIYTVMLVVTDAHGCTDTADYISYINITKPVAGFYMDDSFSICPPITVHFFNTSTGAISYLWQLGDGSSSVAVNPSDLYISTGLDTVLLVATNLYGCKDTAIGHVNIYGYAGAFSYSPLSGCSPLTVNFRASLSNVPTIIWDFSDGVTSSVSMIDSISHVYTVPGAYIPKLILSDNSGCENSSLGIDTIKVDGVIPGFTTMPNPVCLGTTFNFVDTSKSFWSTITTWNWLFDGATSGISAPSFTLNTIGTFPATLQVTDGWGCTANVTEDVTVYPPPVITVSPDTTICVGDAALLRGFGGVSYTWSPAGTLSCTACNPTFASPIVITNYTVTGTDEHGCSNTDTVSVFLKTKTVSVAYRDTEICLGAIVQLLDSGANKFNWIPAAGLSNSHIADPLASPTQSTTYMIIAQLASCIPDTNYVDIIVHPLPTVSAGPDQTVLEGTEVQLSATGKLINKYWWEPYNTLSCDSCANPVATMSVTTTYVVTVATEFGCESSDSVRIFIFCDKSQIFIPNSFTPNGDGQNDIFYPRGKGVSIIKSFRIYNRWGEELFERSGIQINDASNAWDGSYHGSAPKPDVYVYIIDAICETGAPINIKGDVTIIR